MKLHAWNDIPNEELNPVAKRRVLHADSITVARLFLAKGAVVPRHSHPNEQITMMESGKLRFIFDDSEVVVEGGQIVQIPGGEPHAVVALEDSLATDLFSPVREDWLRGDDAYLRGGGSK